MDLAIPTLDFWAGWISAYLAMLVLQGLRALAQRLRQWRQQRAEQRLMAVYIHAIKERDRIMDEQSLAIIEESMELSPPPSTTGQPSTESQPPRCDR